MKRGISRAVAPLAVLTTLSALAIALPTAAQAAVAPNVRITEWMYNPVHSSGEYVELTNLGSTPVSLVGWSFDDDSEQPGTVPLDSLGTLAAGASAIVTESSDAVFRSEWNVGADVKILGGNLTNLGRADEINLFDGSDPVADLVDRLAYNDAVKGPRTQGVAGIPTTAAALGANDAAQWQLATVGDAEGSRLSTTGDIGSPGTSRFAPAVGRMAITEWMYKNEATSGEFVELTNIGGRPVNLDGWSYATTGGGVGLVPLSGLGEVAAGESVVVTQSPADTFRTEWGLAGSVKVLGGVTHNIGRADDVEVYDATGALVDQLTYNDQGTGTVKGPRTDGVSGEPTTSGALGANDASQWQLAAVGDADKAWSVTVGTKTDIASPGTSRFGNGLDPRGTSGGDPGTGTGSPIDPNWAHIRINEVSSDNGATPVGDAVELYNDGGTDVSIAGWLQIDSGAASSATAFSAQRADGTATTVVPAHGFVYLSSTRGLGSGGDGVQLYLPDGANGTAGTLVDSATYTAGQAGTDETNGFGAGALARCPDGSGAFVSVATKSFGASNAAACQTVLTDPTTGGGTGGPTLTCQPEAPSGTGTLPPTALVPGTWPGSADVAVADAQCAWLTSTGPEGRDVSGLVFDPSNPNVLYSVKNKSWVFRLVKQNGIWVSDTGNGWGAGKEIFFPGSTDPSTNQPDSEGLSVGPDGALYVTTERNNAFNADPLNSVLRFDPTQSGTQLVATDEWNLTAEFPELHAGNKTEANLGFEGVTLVPDSYLVSNGFVDSSGATYKPSDYPLHGTGLYFAALENDGKLYAYALNSDHTFHRVAVVDTGMGHVMDVQYDADAKRIWALCDNTCGVTSTLLKVSSTGTIVPDVAYAKPAALPVDNVEGFAIAPSSTCVNGTKEVVWSDDGVFGTGPGTPGEGHALYSGRVSCDLGLGGQGVPSGPAAWSSTKVYTTGDKVTYNGKVFRAQWWTSGEVPGSTATGSWEELATAADGTAVWTPSRVFTTGDVVTYNGTKYKALWWTRNQAPGGVGGPWTEVPAPGAPGSFPAWSAATVYVGGETVSYLGRTYKAQWWTAGTTPGTVGSAWKLLG